jgi:large subunit ribosomal protein L9
MKILLIQDVDGLGLAGEVKDVADGYGRNYLVAKGFAVLATPGALKDADLHSRRATERRERLADEMAVLAEAVRQTTLVFEARAGEKGRLYGSITTAEIADKLAEAVGKEIDRRKLSIQGPIKQLGTHNVTLRLSSDAVADFDVIVESDMAYEPSDQEEPVAEEPVEPFEQAEVDEPAIEE